MPRRITLQAQAPGRVIAHCLSGAWRAETPPLAVDAVAVEAVADRLIVSGAGALAWRRCAPAVAGTPVASRLKDEAQAMALSDMRRELSIAHLSSLAAELDARVVVFKGYAAAQAYAETWLRVHGDIDLIVRPQDRATFEAAVLADPARAGNVDLHDGLAPAYGVTAAEILAEAKPLAGPVAAPRPEHHLRLVIVHLLKHGGWRPIWLVDVAALVEQAGEDFDWDLALGAHPRVAGWMRAVIATARELLGCRTDHTPIDDPAPRWLVEATLAAWNHPDPYHYRPIQQIWRDPVAWLGARWPLPLRSGFGTGGRAFQDGRGLRQVACLANDLVEHVRARSAAQA